MEIDKSSKLQSKISIKEVAKLTNTSEQFIRVGLQRGALPYGSAVKLSSRWTYCIYPKKLYEYVWGNEYENKI